MKLSPLSKEALLLITLALIITYFQFPEHFIIVAVLLAALFGAYFIYRITQTVIKIAAFLLILAGIILTLLWKGLLPPMF
jgi:ABC-type Fe3+-siderophore transport system permease subunit